MNPAERATKTPHTATTIFALLWGLFSVRGTGAPKVSQAPRALRAYLALPVSLLALLGALGAFTAQAAQAESPWFHLTSRVLPSHIAPGGEGTVVVQAIDLGNRKTSAPVTLSDVLPSGLHMQEEEVEGKMVPSVSFFTSSSNKNFAYATGEDLSEEKPLELCSSSGQQVTCRTHTTNPALKFIEEPPFNEPPFTTEPEFIELVAHSTGIPALLPYAYLEMRLKVKAEPAASEASNEVEVSGGGAPTVTAKRPLPISSEPVQFGVEDFRLTPEEEGGKPDTHAGSHPYQLTNVLTFNRSSEEDLKPPALPRNLHFQLPPGQIGNATAVEQCSDQEFAQVGQSGEANECQGNTAIGVAVVTASTNVRSGPEEVFTVPLFNLTPATGEPARFGFEVLRNPVILDTALRDGPGEDYGVTVNVENITQIVGFQSATVTFWGTPEDQSHNEARGWGCLLGGAKAVGRPCIPSVEPHPRAFLTMPTNCAAPFDPTVSGESWPRKTSSESEPVAATFEPVPYQLQDGSEDPLDPLNPLKLTGCNQLAFSPTVVAEPSTDSASSPSGLDFNLNFDDEGLANGNGVAQSQLNKTEVVLPEGLTINPSAGVGLGGCTEADFARETLESEPGAGCPNDSKLGTVEIESPLLPQKQKVTGSIFIAQPYENPFNSLVALYIVARNTEAGVLIKLAGKVTPNPVTGQLTTTFENNPQLPFDHFNFHFREGQQAPLISPPTCGAYNILAGLTPWSEPAAALTDASAFTITKGAEGGPCPAGGAPPFAPKIEAGTQNNNAGTFSPFYLHLTRTDAEQEISKFSTNLPPGLTGDLSGIPFCSDASIALARTKSGAQEEASPSCPAASQIGHTLVGTGVGAVLAYVPGKIYLAGAFGGDPLSIVSVTSAVVGPFDLGTVVIRFGLRIDPYTAQVSVDPTYSEPIPTILDGIVTHVRDIRVYIERPGNAPFTLNPTSCTPTSIGSTLTSSLGASSTIASPFQAASCANLKFAPKFAVSTAGTTSKAKGASLKVKLTYPSAPQGTQANITRVKVDLPKQLPSQLKTLQKACTAKQFELNPENCPKESMVGKAKAITPLIPVPLEGPAIFVSHGNEAFPSLIMVLKGAPPYNITIDLVGSTFISKAGITSSTFKTVPDQPIGSFELTLPQGKYAALAANLPAKANHSFCGQTLSMPTEFLAQNGAKINESTKISVTGCKKATKKKKKTKKQTKSHKGGK